MAELQEQKEQRIAQLEAENERLTADKAKMLRHNESHRQRWELLQAYQCLIPDPYRQTICNILANGGFSASLDEERTIKEAIANKKAKESEAK